MTEQMTYIADDGTVFYDEEECLIYEWKNKIDDMKSGDLLILDYDQHPCYFTPAHAYYVVTRTDEAVDLLKEIFDYYDETCPWNYKEWNDPGTISDSVAWIKNKDNSEWYSYYYLDSLRRNIINTCNTMEQIMVAV